MNLCMHRSSGIVINPEVPDHDKVYKCARCGKNIKPVRGLGAKGSLIILLIATSLFTKSPWFDSLINLSQENSGRIWAGLPWVGLFIFVTAIRYITLKYCIPVYKVVEKQEHIEQ